MTTDTSLWAYIINAGFIVKCVMFILIAASLASWSIIFERIVFYKKQWRDIRAFEKTFWSGNPLHTLLQKIEPEQANTDIFRIFQSGFQTFLKLRKTNTQNQSTLIEGVHRAMNIAQAKTEDQLEWPLSLLATIGSVSPYIGLFGTVWGIMTAFQALGSSQQASIAMVAPGISEALVATAIGLFAAIPAVIAYNRFNNQVNKLQSYYDTFGAELIHILDQETITKETGTTATV